MTVFVKPVNHLSVFSFFHVMNHDQFVLAPLTHLRNVLCSGSLVPRPTHESGNEASVVGVPCSR